MERTVSPEIIYCLAFQTLYSIQAILIALDFTNIQSQEGNSAQSCVFEKKSPYYNIV